MIPGVGRYSMLITPRAGSLFHAVFQPIDTQRAIILNVEATPARWTAEVAATKTMLERTQECFGLKPQRLAGDAAYGSGLMIGWLMRRGIEPHIPLLDRRSCQ
jgi:hypothetical protein